MIATKENVSEIMKKFREYMSEYGYLYDSFDREYIEENFLFFLFSTTTPDILAQIYAELDVWTKEPNLYMEHFLEIQKLFGFDHDILDVASGKVPAFANLMAAEQLKINKGTITLYEPCLLTTKPKYKNMTLHMQSFKPDTDIKSFDLVTALLPCAATDPLIRNICPKDIDFYIQMCGCGHTIDGYHHSSKVYQDHIINLAKSLMSNPDELEVRYSNHPTNELGPTLIRRKHK